VGLLLILGCAAVNAPRAWGQDADIARKLKNKIAPVYPELAQRVGIQGVVKLQVRVLKDGGKDARVHISA